MMKRGSSQYLDRARTDGKDVFNEELHYLGRKRSEIRRPTKKSRFSLWKPEREETQRGVLCYLKHSPCYLHYIIIIIKTYYY